MILCLYGRLAIRDRVEVVSSHNTYGETYDDGEY
jgi:hypothetical protein